MLICVCRILCNAQTQSHTHTHRRTRVGLNVPSTLRAVGNPQLRFSCLSLAWNLSTSSACTLSNSLTSTHRNPAIQNSKYAGIHGKRKGCTMLYNLTLPECLTALVRLQLVQWLCHHPHRNRPAARTWRSRKSRENKKAERVVNHQ